MCMSWKDGFGYAKELGLEMSPSEKRYTARYSSEERGQICGASEEEGSVK